MSFKCDYCGTEHKDAYDVTIKEDRTGHNDLNESLTFCKEKDCEISYSLQYISTSILKQELARRESKD
ncbi:MAG: hypothetical protein ACXABG_12785 [Promethearchaeota archaeon]|jgi:hypothetical protein